MNIVNSDVNRYLRLRKTLRTIETVLIAVSIIAFIIFGGSFSDVFICLAAAIIVPESLIFMQRHLLKNSISHEIEIAEIDLKFCIEMKREYEKIKDILSQSSISSDWISAKVQEFQNKSEDTKQAIEGLKSIKRLVIF